MVVVKAPDNSREEMLTHWVAGANILPNKQKPSDHI